MKRPLCGLVTAFAAGIAAGAAFAVPLEPCLLLAAAALGAFLLLYRTRWSLPPLLLFVAVGGLIALRSKTPEADSAHIAHYVGDRDQNIALRGTIITLPDEVADGRTTFVLQLCAMRSTGQWQRVRGRVYVSVSKHSADAHQLQYGDQIECTALLRLPKPPSNPGEFDWRGWLQRNGISFTATVRARDTCTVLSSGKGNQLIHLALPLKRAFERALRLGLEDVPEVAGVLAAIIIGERSEIPPDTYADFQRSGVFHIFAISGLHVGLVAVLIMIALQVCRVPRRWSGLVAIPLVVLYVLATGARPGATRAMLMTVVWLVAAALLRPADQLNNLAAAAAAVLVWNPWQLFDGGFILSFTVVAGLITLTPPIDRGLAMLLPQMPDPLLPPALVPRWRRWLATPLRWLRVTLAASTAAWVSLLPLMAWYFHLFSPVSILANVVVVPMLGLITAAGLLSLPAAVLSDSLAAVVNNANYALLSIMIAVVDVLSRIPWGHRFVQMPPLLAVAAYYGVAVVTLAANPTARWRRWLLALGVAAAVVWMGARWWQARAVVELTAFDLREGAAVLLNLPGERCDLLVDGGSARDAQRIVLPALRAAGVDRLEGVIASGGTRAHVEGLTVLLQELPIRQVMESGLPTRSKYFVRWQDQLRACAMPVCWLRRGDTVAVPPPTALEVLHPPLVAAGSRSADNAVVLRLIHGPTTVLLTADIGARVEAQLVAAHPELRAHLVICGVNAADPNLSDLFLEHVRPEVVIVLAGAWPSQRYPHPKLAERVAARGICCLRTDEIGAVIVRLTSAGYELRRIRR